MRKTDNFELNLIDAEEFVSVEDLNENAQKTDEILKEHDTPEYDVSEQTNVEKLSSGESLKVALRKLAKAVADYISHKADQVVHITAEERTAWNAKLGTDKIAANLTTTTEGMVLAAAMGKNLKEQIDTNATDISTLNSNMFSTMLKEGITNANTRFTGLLWNGGGKNIENCPLENGLLVSISIVNSTVGFQLFIGYQNSGFWYRDITNTFDNDWIQIK